MNRRDYNLINSLVRDGVEEASQEADRNPMTLSVVAVCNREPIDATGKNPRGKT